jgi:hypothetical protein
MFPIYLLLLSFLRLQTTLPLLVPLLLLLVRYVSGISAVAVVPILLTPFPLLAPLLLLLIRDDPVMSSVASSPACNSGNNMNRRDVNNSRDAINCGHTRNNTDKQQQQGGVLLADASNRRHTWNIRDKQQQQHGVLADASNRRHTRNIRDKQQQQRGVSADPSNRHIPGSSGTSNSSTGC